MAILFDLDGVLIDSRVPITSCFNHALESVGHPARPPELLEPFIGPPLADAFAEILEVEPSSAEVAASVAAYRDVYGDVSLRDTVVFDGVPEMLSSLSERRLAVATSKPVAFAEPILETLGLRRYFDVVAGPDLRTRGEDKLATVAAAVLALRGEATVMVGDRSFDILAAREHGLLAVGVTWGIGSPEELLAAGADHLVASPAELAELLSG